jgi:hypothetical protein
MQELDRVLPTYCNPATGIKKAVFQYSDGTAKFKYGIRKDAASLVAERPE